MAEWWVERGIGEDRAVLTDGARILEARIRPHGSLGAGAVIGARLVKRLPQRNQAIAAWEDGEALVSPCPRDVSEGGALAVAITRPPIAEPGKPKRALARPAIGESPRPAPSLSETLDGAVTTIAPHGPDRLEALGWSELLEEAATGRMGFSHGMLSIALTPAMTLIDVDGETDAATLAIEGARAAAKAIRRLDIAGSIGIDLPTVADRAVRQKASETIDATLPQPFERTAVNGFGFVQIVRRRSRLSLPELYALDAPGAHARALLRKAERTGGAGERMIAAHPVVGAAIRAIPDWDATLARHLGANVALREDDTLTISGGHVQARHP